MSAAATILSLAIAGIIAAFTVSVFPRWRNALHEKEIELSHVKEAFQSFEKEMDGDDSAGELPDAAHKLYRDVNPRNPLNNVLLTDIHGDPNRLPAPPAFARDVWRDTHDAFEKQTQLLHPDQPNIIQDMYGDIYEKHQLETGLMRQMYSMPSTRVMDDRDTLQKILAKDMFSGKEDSPQAAEARRLRTERHIMR